MQRGKALLQKVKYVQPLQIKHIPICIPVAIFFCRSHPARLPHRYYIIAMSLYQAQIRKFRKSLHWFSPVSMQR